MDKLEEIRLRAAARRRRAESEGQPEPEPSSAGLMDRGRVAFETAKRVGGSALSKKRREIGEGAGLTARSLLSGPANIAEAVVNVPGAIVNTGADIMGMERPVGTNRALTGLIDKIGLPEYPQDFVGRIAETAAEGLTIGGPVIKLGQKMAGAASAVTSGVGRTLSAAPTAQLAAEVPASLAGEAVASKTDNPIAIMAASIAGAMAVPSKIPKAEMRSSRYQKAAQAESELGIPGAATDSQKLGTPQEIAKHFAMSKTDELIAAARESNSKVSGALEKFLRDLSGTGSIVESGSAGRIATKKFQKSLRRHQQEVSTPLYKAAEAAEDVIDTSSVEKTIQGLIRKYSPRQDPVSKSVVVEKVYTLVEQAMAQVRSAQGDIGDLHRAKEWIDGLIEPKTGDKALVLNEKRILSQIKDELVETMAEQSPLYAKAKEMFELYQRPIDAAKDSFIGVLSNSKNLQLTTALDRVFSGELAEVRKLQSAISKSDPRAYEAMFKAHLKKKMSDLSDDLVAQGDSGVYPENMPAILNKTFGGAAGLSRLAEVAPTPQARKTLKNLSTVFDAASRGRNDQSISKEVAAIDASLVNKFKRFVSKLGGLAVVWGSHGIAARDALQPSRITPDIGRSKRQKALIDSIFNRDFDDHWTATLSVDPNSAKWVKAVEQMLGDLDEAYGIEEEDERGSVMNKTLNIK